MNVHATYVHQDSQRTHPQTTSSRDPSRARQVVKPIFMIFFYFYYYSILFWPLFKLLLPRGFYSFDKRDTLLHLTDNE